MTVKGPLESPEQVAPILSQEPQRSWRRRLSERLWGYDYFVSYHWASGGAYAVALAQRLQDLGYDVFLDRAEYAMGDDWKSVGERALHRTQRLVLVATREAVTASPPVAHEVRIFTARGRQVIAVVFAAETANGRRSTLTDLKPTDCPLLELMPSSKLYIEDDFTNLARGPADAVVQQLTNTYRVMRRRDIRGIFVGILAAIVISFATFATVSWGNAVVAYHSAKTERDNAIKREREARHEQGVSWLARSAASERRYDYLSARIMAMKAIAFAGFGPVPAPGDELLRPESAEFEEAQRRIVSLPATDVLYVAKLKPHSNSAYVQCVFNRLGTAMTAVSSDGEILTIDFQKRESQHVSTSVESLFNATKHLRLDHHPVGIAKSQLALGDKLTADVVVEDGKGSAIWIAGPDVSPTTTSLKALESLTEGENDEDAEVVELVAARPAPIIVGTFQSNYVQSVVVLDQFKGAAQLFRNTGEMSDDSGVVRSAASCVSEDGTMCVVSQTNRINNADNAITVFKRVGDAFKTSSTMIVDGPAVTHLTLSRDKRLLAGAAGDTIQIWDLSQSRIVATLTGHAAKITHVDFSPDLRSLASASADGMIVIWGLPVPDVEWIDATTLRGDRRRWALEDATSPSPKDESSCLSPSKDLLANWKIYWSASGLGDEMRYGTLMVKDQVAGTQIMNVSKTDVPQYTTIRFSGDGLRLLLTGQGERAAIVPIVRARRDVDYRSAYAFVRFTEAGCEFAPDSDATKLRHVPVPRRVSSIYLSESVPARSLQDAMDWYSAAGKE